MAITKNRQFEESVPSSIAGSDAETSFFLMCFLLRSQFKSYHLRQ